jgi:molecular chaperone DnaK
VSAKDQGTGKEQSIRIEASSGLTENEIQEMVKDAESHSQEDRERKEAVEARNAADAKVYEAEKNLKEFGDKLDGADKSAVEDAANRLKELLKGEDTAAIRSGIEALDQAWHRAAEKLYQQSAPPGGAAGTPPPAGDPKPKGKDGAVDADYEVMN